MAEVPLPSLAPVSVHALVIISVCSLITIDQRSLAHRCHHNRHVITIIIVAARIIIDQRLFARLHQRLFAHHHISAFRRSSLPGSICSLIYHQRLLVRSSHRHHNHHYYHRHHHHHITIYICQRLFARLHQRLFAHYHTSAVGRSPLPGSIFWLIHHQRLFAHRIDITTTIITITTTIMSPSSSFGACSLVFTNACSSSFAFVPLTTAEQAA